VEEIDAANALRRVYPGAVHLSQGDTYVVQTLDLKKRVALARRQNVNYYTETLETSEVRILRTMESKIVGPVQVYYGQVKVRQHIISYRRMQQFTETVLDETPVSLPPDTFETMATWWDMPKGTLDRLNKQGHDWLAAMHAAEHACIGMLPMFAMCDRWDLGWLSINTHPDTGQPQIIVYDAYPGGVGITEKGYRLLPAWWAATLKLIEECPCDGGCPSCVQSPKCGNNNTRLDKDGAAYLLRALLASSTPTLSSSQRTQRLSQKKGATV
jgi:DEAD/DEAH box helicase domain-containing protein